MRGRKLVGSGSAPYMPLHVGLSLVGTLWVVRTLGVKYKAEELRARSSRIWDLHP